MQPVKTITNPVKQAITYIFLLPYMMVSKWSFTGNLCGEVGEEGDELEVSEHSILKDKLYHFIYGR